MTALGTMAAMAGRMFRRAPNHAPNHAPVPHIVAVTGMVPPGGLCVVNLCVPQMMQEILGGVDLKDNPHLELPARIDAEGRMLRLLADDLSPLKPDGAGFIFRLHLKSLMSAGFIAFERAHGLSLKGRLTVSVPVAEAVADEDAASFAVNYLGSRGAGFAVHGLTLASIARMPQDVQGFFSAAKYLGLNLSRGDLALGEKERLAAAQAVMRLSRARLIASSGGDEALAAIARDCGIVMIEGRSL